MIRLRSTFIRSTDMKTTSIEHPVRPVRFLRHLAATVLAASLMAAFTGARAQSSMSEVSVLSALPIAVSVTAPVMVLSAGVALTVVAVEAVRRCSTTSG